MINVKVSTYFSYMLVIYLYKGKGYGNLVANIGPINEKSFTNIIPNQPTILYYNFLTSQKNLYLESLKHLVLLTVGRL